MKTGLSVLPEERKKTCREYRCHATTTRQNRGLDVTLFVTFLAKNAG